MKNILSTCLLALFVFANSCVGNKDLIEKIKQDLSSIDLDRGQLNGVAKRFNDVQNAIGVAPEGLKNDPEFGPKFREVASKADGLAVQYNATNLTFNEMAEALEKLLNDLNTGKITSEAAETAYEKIAATRTEAKNGMMSMGSTFDAFSAEYAKLMAAWGSKKDGN